MQKNVHTKKMIVKQNDLNLQTHKFFLHKTMQSSLHLN